MSRLTRKQALERARDLVRLGADQRTPEDEARNAAVKACKYIRKYKLLDDPLADIASHPGVKAAKTVYDAINDPGVRAAGKVVADLFKQARERR